MVVRALCAGAAAAAADAEEITWELSRWAAWRRTPPRLTFWIGIFRFPEYQEKKNKALISRM
jgi:hypothetical protein